MNEIINQLREENAKLKSELEKRSPLQQEQVPSLFIGLDLTCSTHRMDESQIAVWCRSSEDAWQLLKMIDSASDHNSFALLQKQYEREKQRAEAAESDLKSAEIRVDAWKEEVDEMRETQFRRFNNEECWIYQGDGEDYPESLICPVVISAEQLRIFLAAERGRDEALTHLYNVHTELTSHQSVLFQLGRAGEVTPDYGRVGREILDSVPNSLIEFGRNIRQQANGGSNND